MTSLFISHASEDKEAFVRPLAKALESVGFDVWLDELKMTVGDSLRSKIDEALRKADFGVVVFSKSFFAKKWTEMELNGLVALQKKNQKLILPIWYQVTEEEVCSYSPMLAGILAARGDDGVDRVVEDLKRTGW